SANITAQLDAYLATSDGIVTPQSSLVTGYDFLEDAANAVASELTAGIGSNATTLITPHDISPTDPTSWTADQLRAELLNNRFDISFLAGHFSAGSALAADYSTRLLASEIVASSVDMTNMLIFSAGCHSGYNSVNAHGVANVTLEPDWAQAFAQKGATLIAGTGYQYGDTDFIEYSERLYLDFSEQLRMGTGPVSIGNALVAAKQNYLAETPELRPLHEKSLLISTIFGLPMLRIDMPDGRITPTNDSSIVTATTAFTGNPGNTLGLEYADVGINASLTANQVPLDVLGEEESTVTATYLSGSNGTVVNPAEPMLPLEMRNVNVPGQVLRGVGFRGGAFTDVGNVLPLTGAATTEIRGVHPPFVSDTFYPVLPWQANYYDALVGGDTRLAVFPAQYKSDGAFSPTGTMRQFSSVNFRLYYSNYTTQSPISGSNPALAAAPSIATISAAVDDGVVTFSVRVVGDPAVGIQEVWLVYTGDGSFAGQWQALDLAQDSNDSTLWQGTLNLNGATNIYYMVQAANGVGLVSASTNLGAYYQVTADGVPVPPEPEATEISLQNPPTSGAYSTVTTVSAVLTSSGSPLANQPVRFGLGAQQRVATTDENGVATAELALLGLPGNATLQVSFGGSDFYLPASAGSPFTITKQGTVLMLTPEDATAVAGSDSGIYATLTDAAERPFNEKTVIFQVDGENGSYTAAEITNFNGRAFLGTVPLPPGSYSVTATFGDVVTIDGESLNLTDPRYLPSSAVGTLLIEEAGELIYISTDNHSSIGGINFRNEDILTFDTHTGSWEIIFDGSDVGLFAENVNSFAKLSDGSYLMSFEKSLYLSSVGNVYTNDIVRFVPTSLGSNTA
ncbi:MAG: Ig-like domain repeat protein, partial [Anaerolineales bacterium]|nr:Ig-like domain repeat protein [Anaerolineales bacterium]